MRINEESRNDECKKKIIKSRGMNSGSNNLNNECEKTNNFGTTDRGSLFQ